MASQQSNTKRTQNTRTEKKRYIASERELRWHFQGFPAPFSVFLSMCWLFFSPRHFYIQTWSRRGLDRRGGIFAVDGLSVILFIAKHSRSQDTLVAAAAALWGSGFEPQHQTCSWNFRPWHQTSVTTPSAQHYSVTGSVALQKQHCYSSVLLFDRTQ